jgi:hemerythrin-like metal-binding protein
MGRLTWNTSWETGIPKIDEQHKRLFEQLDVLMNAVIEGGEDDPTPDLLAFLVIYVEAHFRDEESAMTASNYPGKEGHEAIHQGLRDEVAQFMTRYQSDPKVLTQDVLGFLVHWLIDHISQEDQRLADHLRLRAEMSHEAIG